MGQIAISDRETEVKEAYLIQEVRRLSERIGILRGEISDALGTSTKSVFQSSRTILLSTVVLGSVLVLIFGLLVSRSISQPIANLAWAVGEVGRGALDTRVDINSRDEVGILANAFNEMADKLRESHEGLEVQVRERTRELTNANELLAKEVAERTRAEAALKATASGLRRSNRDLEDFASVAAHDLQEPLRKIQTFGERLGAKAGGALSADGRRYLERVQDAAVRMQTLINDLLTFSRISTRGEPFVRVDLGEVARGVVLDLEGRMEEVGGRVEVGELGTLDADPTQMRQLLQNLIGNGLKFHRPEVPAVVTVRGERLNGRGEAGASGGESNRLYEISVEDNGIGFDEKYLDRAFTIFQRLHGRGRYEGTGVGLAVCRKIVERHGGTITARSTPGQGSTFLVTVPAHHDEGRGS